MSFLIKKIINYFSPVLPTRKQIILSALDFFLREIVFKYDYFLTESGVTTIFQKNENMMVMTILPSGANLIAYKDGKLRIWGSFIEYNCPEDIKYMIAISNEEIITITKNGSFVRRNFITDKLINIFGGYNYTEVKYIALLSGERLVTFSSKIQIWNYEGECIYTFNNEDFIFSINVINDDVITRTYDGELKVYDTRTYECRIVYDKYTPLRHNIIGQVKYFIHSYYNDCHIYELKDSKILCDCVFYDNYKAKSLFGYRQDIKNTVILSDGRIAFLFEHGAINLFNPKSKQFESEMKDHFTNISYIVALPDDRLAMITNDSMLRIYDFNTHNFDLVIEIDKTLSYTEILIKLQMLSQLK